MTTSLTIRMDNGLKADAEEFFDDIGMTLTTAITCFFKKCLADGEIPFKLTRQRKAARLAAALEEAKAVANDPDAPTCTDPAKIEEFMVS
jgi:DNA-damage-inducible protein J